MIEKGSNIKMKGLLVLSVYGDTWKIELNDLRKIICFKKSEVSVERISVCNVIENLAKHGRHCLPCSYTNDIIEL